MCFEAMSYYYWYYYSPINGSKVLTLIPTFVGIYTLICVYRSAL